MDLAPRKTFNLATGTPAEVGPSTYTVTQESIFKNNWAPFLSSSKRYSKPPVYTDVFYDLSAAQRSKIKYGNSIAFTGERDTLLMKSFEESTYDDITPKLRKVKPVLRPRGLGKLFVCRVPYRTDVSAPSVPTKADENGYNITLDNDLVKIPPDEYDLTIGPAFYNVPTGEINFNTTKYGGCAWSKRTAIRLKTDKYETPGPASYDVNYKFCQNRDIDEQFRSYMRKCCNVPRYTCELMCHAKREGLPGPGYYETVDVKKLCKKRALKRNSIPFLDTTQRFEYGGPKNPGPTDYNVSCDCVNLKRNFGVRNVPFLVESPRFKKSATSANPGPSWYSPPVDLIADKIRKKKRHYGPVVGFDSTAKRTWTFVEGNFESPGPLQYCLDLNRPRCCPREGDKKTSVFQSRVCRFRKTDTEGAPGPSTYHTEEIYKRMFSRDPHHKNGPAFFVGQKKFIRTYDFADIFIPEDNPNVGAYNIRKPSDDTGAHFYVAPRFTAEKGCGVPGPGYYTIHPVYSEAVNRAKATHNARLRNEVNNSTTLRKVRPKKPEKPGKKKLLRWFIRQPPSEC